MTDGKGIDASGLVGRAVELAGLTSLVDEAARDGAALLLTGEPGVGKTALVNAAAEMAAARGMRVIRGAGVEYESEISFSGLHQLVGPLSAELDELRQASRSALQVALGFGAGPSPTEMAVLHAALSLFVAAASQQPLLVVLDDLHVLDRASRSVASFVARRAGGHRIGVLATVRTGIVETPDRLRLPELRLKPLADADAIRLLSHRFTDLPNRVIVDVAHQAQGNPLALLEFGALAVESGTSRSGHIAPGTGPAEEVRALYAARIARLPQDTRELLLLAALEGSGNIGVLEAAGGAPVDALDAAERDHLVRVSADGSAVIFQHPLIRSAVVERASLARRRAAHRRLAGALVGEPERRADHLSMATTVPDESVAQIIEAGARHSLRRGDVLGAMARLRRAAALSSDREVGGRRLAHAAYIGASVAGHLELSHQLMRQLNDDTATRRSLPAAAAAGYVSLMTEGDAATAHRLLVEAIERHPARDDVSLEDLSPALFTLWLVCHYSGRIQDWSPLRDIVSTLPRVSASSPISLVRILENVGSVPDELLRDLDEQLVRIDEVTDADVITRTALAASYLDRLSQCRKLLTHAVSDARDSGTVGGALPALIMTALDHLYTGRWSDAEDAAVDIITLSDDTGYRLISQVGHRVAAMVAAHRGDTDACDTHCQALFEWAASRHLVRLEHWAHQAQGRSALGSSDFETAFRHLSAITAPGVLPPFNIEALWTASDLVEAALYSGRADEARTHAAAVREAGVSRVSPRFALMTATVTAMTSAPSEMAGQFDEALALPGIEQWPFEVARTHLAYGERLRRQAMRAEARVQLSVARERFERLGAVSFAARAAAELRASGMTRASGAHAGDALTPQELEVAGLAAAGLSTKEIAARLVLSPRTVSAHLYRAFPKLGITSRAALRDALNDRAAGRE